MGVTAALTLAPLVEQALAQGIPLVEEVINAANTEKALAASNTPPTPEQQAAIDAAYASTSAALQAATPSA
jgi:hypothetical protein